MSMGLGTEADLELCLLALPLHSLLDQQLLQHPCLHNTGSLSTGCEKRFKPEVLL